MARVSARKGILALALSGMAVGVAACTQSALEVDGASSRPSAAILSPQAEQQAPKPSKASQDETGRTYAGDVGTAGSQSGSPQRAAAAEPQLTPAPAAAQVAAKSSNGCLDVGSIRERDIARNRTALKRMNACIKLDKFTEGGLPWQIYTITAAKRRGPLWAVPHDNEDVAFDTAVYALARYGGVIVATEAGEQRSLRGQDANRNFNKSAAIARKCRLQKAAAPRYTDAFIKPLPSGQPIIALHSNANGYSGNGGRGTISIWRKSAIMRAHPSRKAKGALADEDNILLVAGRRPMDKDRRLKKLVTDFNNKGVHVIAELVTPAKNDCSLSNYVVLNGIAKYYNIEVQDGQGKVQRQMLRELMSYGPR